MNQPVQFGGDVTRFPARFTTAEFVEMIGSGLFDDMKIELIEGELERIPPAGNDHARRQTMLAIRLATACGEALVRVEAGIDLGRQTLVATDVALLTAPVTGKAMLAPDAVRLAVEVAETTVLRDTTLKRVAYARAGIATYWVIDAARSVTHIYARPLDGDYADVHTIPFGEPIPVPGTDATITIE